MNFENCFKTFKFFYCFNLGTFFTSAFELIFYLIFHLYVILINQLLFYYIFCLVRKIDFWMSLWTRTISKICVFTKIFFRTFSVFFSCSTTGYEFLKTVLKLSYVLFFIALISVIFYNFFWSDLVSFQFHIIVCFSLEFGFTLVFHFLCNFFRKNWSGFLVLQITINLVCHRIQIFLRQTI